MGIEDKCRAAAPGGSQGGVPAFRRNPGDQEKKRSGNPGIFLPESLISSL